MEVFCTATAFTRLEITAIYTETLNAAKLITVTDCTDVTRAPLFSEAVNASLRATVSDTVKAGVTRLIWPAGAPLSTLRTLTLSIIVAIALGACRADIT